MNNVFEIGEPGNPSGYLPGATYNVPDPIKRHDENWYMDNMGYIIGFYNSPTNNTNNVSSIPPVDRMMRNLDFILGEQEWGNWGYLVNQTENSSVFWRKNRKAAVIMDKMVGAASERIKRALISGEPLSPDAKSKRMEKINVEMFKYLIKPAIKGHSMFKVQDTAEDFQSKQEVMDWGDKNIKEHLSEVYIQIAEHLAKTRKIPNKAEFFLLNAVATGLASAEVVVDGGRPLLLWHQPFNTIFDNRQDQRYGEKARFWGVVDNMTLSQIFSKYTFLNEEQREEMVRISQDKQAWTNLNVVRSNVTWWGANPAIPASYKDTSISVVRAYWISPSEEDETINTVYMAEIIGNKYMVNYGVCNNIVSQLYEEYEPMLPGFTWTPNMLRGDLNCLISRITDLISESEMYRAKIRQLIAHAKGKVHLIRAAKLGANDSTQNIINDFTDLGIHIIHETGDPQMDNADWSKIVDMTLDPNITGLIEINKLIDSEIESFVGQSKISMGEQTKYVGSKAFSASLDQSAMGTVGIYDGLMYFISVILRYMVNVQKNLYAEGISDFEARAVVGDTGLKLLQASKNKFVEDYLIYITLKDNISDEKMSQINELAKMAITNAQTLKYLPYLIKLMKAKDWNTAAEELESMAKKIENEMEQQAKAQQEAHQQQQQQEQQHEQNMTSLVEQGKQVRKNADTTIKEMKLELDRQKVEIQQIKNGIAPAPVPPPMQQPQQPQQPPQ